MRKYVEYVKESWTPEITMSYLVFGLIAGFQPVKTCLILGVWSIFVAGTSLPDDRLRFGRFP